jgi:hypothetical protein
MKIYVVNGFTVQYIDNINISYIVLISISFNRVWKQPQAWEKNCWFIDNIQNGILIGSQISMNNLDDLWKYMLLMALLYSI